MQTGFLAQAGRRKLPQWASIVGHGVLSQCAVLGRVSGKRHGGGCISQCAGCAVGAGLLCGQ